MERLIAIIGSVIILCAILFDHFYLDFLYPNMSTVSQISSFEKQLSNYEFNKSISTAIWTIGFITVLVSYNLHLFKSKKNTSNKSENI